MQDNKWLVTGGLISFGIALMHVVIIFAGAPGYRYFGAGEEMAVMAEQGSYIPGLITAGVALVFLIFGLYAMSGAKKVRRLPMLKPSLVIITAIYTLRGSGAFIEILGLIYGYEVPIRHVVFSLAALLTGIIHLVGTIKSWKVV